MHDLIWDGLNYLKMKANELRIGNWVNDLGGNGIMQVDGLVISDIGMFNLQGIPLTPEILERCGFEEGEFVLNDNTQTVLTFRDGTVSLWVEGYYQFGQCQYLHQLQNLYFALTGTELEYDPIKETVQRKIDSDFTEIKITDDTIFGRLK